MFLFLAWFSAALDEACARAGRALVLGSGGAARAVVLALAGRGVGVAVVARSPDRAAALRDLGAEVLPWTAAALTDALPAVELLVDATSSALSPGAEETVPALVDRLPDGALVCSLVYHHETALVAAARARGLPALDGGGMLVQQAAEVFGLMTGRDAPIEAMRAALR